MDLEDRLRRLADESRWADVSLEPRPASRVVQARHGAWIARGAIAVGALAVLFAFVFAGFSWLRPVGPVASAPPVGSPLAVPMDDCPDQLPSPLPISNAPGVADEILPFVPRRALVCSYLDGLVSLGTITDAAQLARLRGALNAGTTQEPQACTAELSSTDFYVFEAGGTLLTVAAEPFGCGEVTNGSRTTWGLDKAAFQAVALPTPTIDGFPTWRLCPEAPLQAKAAPPGAQEKLVPFVPRLALVCEYPSSGASPARSILLNQGDAAASLADTLNAVKLETGPDARPCPVDTGHVIQVLFSSATEQLVVDVHLGGCEHIGNGAIDGWEKRHPGALAEEVRQVIQSSTMRDGVQEQENATESGAAPTP